MKRAERFEEMVRVFSSFPLEKDSFEDFYVDTNSKRSDIDAKKDIINSFRIGLNPYMMDTELVIPLLKRYKSPSGAWET